MLGEPLAEPLWCVKLVTLPCPGTLFRSPESHQQYVKLPSRSWSQNVYSEHCRKPSRVVCVSVLAGFAPGMEYVNLAREAKCDEHHLESNVSSIHYNPISEVLVSKFSFYLERNRQRVFQRKTIAVRGRSMPYYFLRVVSRKPTLRNAPHSCDEILGGTGPGGGGGGAHRTTFSEYRCY